VTVLAAASLTEAMTAMAHDFESGHPGTRIRLSFAASSTIVQQVNQGAPADLIALAGTAAMKPLAPGTVVAGGTATLATNTLEIATPAGNPAKVTSLADLSRPDLKVVLCAAPVPCGKAARATLQAAHVSAHVVSYEDDVKAALSKVELGEADAAIVYHSDVVTAGGRVTGVTIPSGVNQVLAYPIARLTDNATARDFMTFTLSPAGQKRLRDNGFQAP